MPYFSKTPRWLRSLLVLSLGAVSVAATPVEFAFRVAHDEEQNPFTREIWGEIEDPDGNRLSLPAFYDGDDTWRVRTRAAVRGNYRFLQAEEWRDDRLSRLPVDLVDADRQRVRNTDSLGPAIRIDDRTGRDFIDGLGRLYVPLGGNLPWADRDEVVPFYRENLQRFAQTGLNWARIWMAHWGQLNLDWIEPQNGENPPLGHLDLAVARRWDAIVAAADSTGVRLQMVLQHHGQYSTTVNSDWDENPWNAANGGFLETPVEFFTHERARTLTRDKFRYIVARWGYSSSIMAWELFNEVKWTDARRSTPANDAAVAAWHDEMAHHLRRFDVHDHLVTTSDDDLTHRLWAAMDYYQPHLYASNMILGVQTLHAPPERVDRPLFYGEVGDDNMINLTSDQRSTGAAHVPMAWAGLFGSPTQPAQLWYIDVLRQQDRWSELASLAAFAQASGLLEHRFDRTTHPSVIGGDLTPWKLQPGYYWEIGPNPEIHLRPDGHEATELMDFRRVLTAANATPAHPYPSRVTFHLHAPAATNAQLTVARVNNLGASLRITLNGEIIADHVWGPLMRGQAAPTHVTFPFRLGYGTHKLVLENPTGPEWVDLAELDLGIDVPALVAIARHAANRSILWVRHRNQLLSAAAEEDLPATSATVQLEDHPAGTWLVTWWDPDLGRTIGSTSVDHDGGTLSLTTPEITRHAAAWLERAD
jgi:hypothetical protein